METIYQNVQISREKGDLSHFIGCLLAGVIRSKLISVQLDHPVHKEIFEMYCDARQIFEIINSESLHINLSVVSIRIYLEQC